MSLRTSPPVTVVLLALGFGSQCAICVAQSKPAQLPKTYVQRGPYILSGEHRFILNGRIISVTSRTLTCENERGRVDMHFRRPLLVWKGRNTSSSDILKPGDHIDAEGIVDSDGVLVPTKITANLVRIVGQVLQVDGDRILVRESSSGRSTEKSVIVDERSEYETGSSRGSVVKQVQIEVIGLALNSHEVLATRIAVYSRGQSPSSPGAVQFREPEL